MKLKKFTLIELLIVIAVIGILSSLLLPILKKARKKAKIAVCTSNQKQLSISFTMYSDDHDSSAPLGSGGWTPWDDYLSPYDGRSEYSDILFDNPTAKIEDLGESHGAVYRCPTDEIQNEYGTDTEILGRSYSITRKYFWDNSRTHAQFMGICNSTNSRKFTDISKPSETILIFDYHHKYSNLSNDRAGKISAKDLYERYEIGLTPHSDKPNFLMIDGHVEKRTPLSTLIKDDGSITTVGDISNTIWDSSPFRQ